MNKNLRIQLAIILYLLFIASLILIKPTYIYKKDGTLKNFGTGQNNTIFPLWLIIFIGAFFSYYLSNIIIFIYVLKRN
tara:strand:+ start:79 stop:312 length:234 start_codon:yes stop_codon:yes gene_type:complete